MTLKLVKLEPKYRRHLKDMMSQWDATDAGEDRPLRHSPIGLPGL